MQRSKALPMKTGTPTSTSGETRQEEPDRLGLTQIQLLLAAEALHVGYSDGYEADDFRYL